MNKPICIHWFGVEESKPHQFMFSNFQLRNEEYHKKVMSQTTQLLIYDNLEKQFKKYETNRTLKYFAKFEKTFCCFINFKLEFISNLGNT